MKKKCTLIILLLSMSLISQSSYKIQFQEESVTINENINAFQWSAMPESSKFNNGYYGWIQFYETPTQAVQNEFKRRGLELLEYIPNKAYLFYFPNNTSIKYLKNNNVRAIVPIKGQYKLSAALKRPSYPSYALNGDAILVTLEFYARANSDDVIKALEKHQITVMQDYEGHNIMAISIPNNCLDVLSNLPFVKWLELKSPPAIKDDERARNLNRSSNLDTQTTAGRNYTGEGIGVMVRDDGQIGPHIDFQGRVDNSKARIGESIDRHGDGVAGVFVGAGNLNPRIRGTAAGSNVFVVDYNPTLLDNETTTLINDGSVQITNSSYSDGCNVGYTLRAKTADTQTKEIPSLAHFFSAGNANGRDCDYGAGDQWGNVTGGHKLGKNVFCVANTSFDGTIASSSARGPAADGRIKPDISAMGNGQPSTDLNNEYYDFGGTSAASPAAAGISAQLYEAYRNLNNGELPQSALIKAAMLNTANEVGNRGPDFIYGWGLVNGLRAVKIIENQSYLSDEIVQGSTNNHVITIPSGATQVNFMLYWSDAPASLGANPALVNDLDLVITDPANNTLLPWVLDATPNPVALNTPATNGEDHLNNMEQVQINNPIAGDYSLDISGFNIPMGPQDYFIVYEVVSENITVTHPNGGENFVVGEENIIHWDAINTTEDFDLEYSTDGGTNWISIATVPSTTRNYLWYVPETLKTAAKVRVASGTHVDSSDDEFSITGQVTGFAFSLVCPNEVTFVWDAITDAESYDVYMLGEKYMEVVGTSATTSVTIPVNATPTGILWAAIVAKNTTKNWTSLRTTAISNEGFLNCSLPKDLQVLEISNDVEDFLAFCTGEENAVVTTIINNPGMNSQNNFDITYRLTGQNPVTETITTPIAAGEQLAYSFSTPISITDLGLSTLSITTNLPGDQDPTNDMVSLDLIAIAEITNLNFVEDFESNRFPPNAWSISNSDNNNTWEEIQTVGSDGNRSTMPYVNNYMNGGLKGEDIITTEIFDLRNKTDALLTFDLAKAQSFSDSKESLRVEIVTVCSSNSTETIYDKEGLELATITSLADNLWRPRNATDWRTEEIDLTAYLGETVFFRFINVTDFSNSTFIDNIKMIDRTILSTNAVNFSEVKLYPNPTSGSVFINLGDQIAKNASIVIANILGQTVQTIPNQERNGKTITKIDVKDYKSGVYFITITSQGLSETKKVIIK